MCIYTLDSNEDYITREDKDLRFYLNPNMRYNQSRFFSHNNIEKFLSTITKRLNLPTEDLQRAVNGFHYHRNFDPKLQASGNMHFIMDYPFYLCFSDMLSNDEDKIHKLDSSMSGFLEEILDLPETNQHLLDCWDLLCDANCFSIGQAIETKNNGLNEIARMAVHLASIRFPKFRIDEIRSEDQNPGVKCKTWVMLNNIRFALMANGRIWNLIRKCQCSI